VAFAWPQNQDFGLHHSVLQLFHSRTVVPVMPLPLPPSSSRWASMNHMSLKLTWTSRKDLCLALCCLQSTAAWSPTSSLTTAYGITNMPMTRTHASPSRHAHRQHTHRAVHSRWMYQTVVTAEWSTPQPGQVRSSGSQNHQLLLLLLLDEEIKVA